MLSTRRGISARGAESFEARRSGSECNPAARLVAIDGETCRRSQDAANGLGPLHIVSAWASEDGIALGQVATDEKSNEITAIPALLGQIALTDALITTDRSSTRRSGRASWRNWIGTGRTASTARTRRPTGGTVGATKRLYFLTPAPPDFAVATEWPWVKAIGYAVRVTRHPDGRETDEVRYYVLSRYLGGKRFAQAVRGHWGIESMHWVLDVTFREDESRVRERTLANNLSWLRRFAVTLLRRHPIMDSIRGKMMRCLMNTQFLTEVLTPQPV